MKMPPTVRPNKGHLIKHIQLTEKIYSGRVSFLRDPVLFLENNSRNATATPGNINICNVFTRISFIMIRHLLQTIINADLKMCKCNVKKP